MMKQAIMSLPSPKHQILSPLELARVDMLTAVVSDRG